MSTTMKVIAENKPTIEEQIAFIRGTRKENETWITLAAEEADPKAIEEAEAEVLMLREIEENLITIKVQRENKEGSRNTHNGQIMHFDGVDVTDEFNEPHVEQAFAWPTIGNSVEVMEGDEKNHHWSDAQVIKVLPENGKANGVKIRTFYGVEFEITDPSRIKPGKRARKEVNNG